MSYFAAVAEWSDEKKHVNAAKEIYFCVYEMKLQAADASEKRRKEVFLYAHFQSSNPIYTN